MDVPVIEGAAGEPGPRVFGPAGHRTQAGRAPSRRAAPAPVLSNLPLAVTRTRQDEPPQGEWRGSEHVGSPGPAWRPTGHSNGPAAIDAAPAVPGPRMGAAGLHEAIAEREAERSGGWRPAQPTSNTLGRRWNGRHAAQAPVQPPAVVPGGSGRRRQPAPALAPLLLPLSCCRMCHSDRVLLLPSLLVNPVQFEHPR